MTDNLIDVQPRKNEMYEDRMECLVTYMVSIQLGQVVKLFFVQLQEQSGSVRWVHLYYYTIQQLAYLV